MKTINSLRVLLKANSVDALLLTYLPHIRWAVGFSGSNGLLYIDTTQALFITDGRYTSQASEEVNGARVIIADQADLGAALVPLLDGGGRIAVTSDTITAASLEHFKSLFPSHEFVGMTGLLNELMAVKSDYEVAQIEAAQRITDAVFGELLEVVKPGLTEKELAAEIVYRQLQHGADGMPDEFWPIVASGPNSAKPHAHATERKLARGDMLVLDFGCVVNGYCSDMTRTLAIGSASDHMRTVYELVLKAQAAALQGARAGITGVQLDAIARDIVQGGGYDIPHGLGHSLGLEIHQWPAANKRNNAPLPAGAVLTIEPGVYIPNEFGVRIEDMVVLDVSGNRNLTTSPKELIVL